MPKRSIAPYHALKASGHSCSRWHEMTANELEAARELTGWLIGFVSEKNHSDFPLQFSRIRERLGEKTKQFKMASESRMLTELGFGKPCKVSLELFDELNDLDLKIVGDLVYHLAYKIHSLARLYTIGINFREVFLLEQGNAAPSHYRDDIDIIVNNLEDYKKQISTFSYQLAKAVFHRCIPNLKIKPTPTDVLVYQHYSNRNAFFSIDKPEDDFNRSLRDVRYFSHEIEAMNYLDMVEHRGCYQHRHAVLAFGPAVMPTQMRKVIDHPYLINTKEVVILLQGAQYRDPEIRRAVRHATLQLAVDTQKLLHVILLTSENTPCSLTELTPDLSQEDGTHFSPLAHGAGFYLSDPRLFSIIYRNIQRPTLENINWFNRVHTQSQPYQDSAPIGIKPNIYIINQEVSVDFRHSKQLDKKGLKAKVALSMNQQLNQTQSMNQEQDLSQTQALSHTQELSQQQSHVQQQNQVRQRSHFWMDTCNFDSFCNRLQIYAEQQLAIYSKPSLEQRLSDTRYHQQTQLHFFDPLANNESFRISIAARIFGIANPVVDGKQCLTSLAGYSFDTIESCIVNNIIKRIDQLVGGINPEQRVFSQHKLLGGRTLVQGQYSWEQYNDKELPKHNLPLLFLASSENNPAAWRYYVLLGEDSLEGLSIDEQSSRMALAESLLSIFNPTKSYTLEETLGLERQFKQLISIYFPENQEYLRIIETFISIFEDHTTDNLKIMLCLLIEGHQRKMEDFLKLLLFFEARSLLDNFYSIHFKYAHTISSVSELLTTGYKKTYDNPVFKSKKEQLSSSSLSTSSGITTINYESYQINNVSPPFIQLAIRTPAASKQDWLPFESFFHHVLLLSAKDNINIVHVDINKMDQIWRRYFSKCLVYTGHQTPQAEKLMACLVEHLITADGLSIGELGNINTLFEGLEKLIDNAISQHTLHEQFAEISGISLLWLDATYALTQNGIKVACREMELHSDAINPVTKRYSVTTDELIDVLKNHQPEDASLKTTLFRYLGTQTLREDLAFYRALFRCSFDTENGYIKELILGYFVLTTTGSHYKPRIDQEQFAREFQDFMVNRAIPQSRITACVEAFFDQYNQTPCDELKGTTTLWGFCGADDLISNTIPAILTKKFEQKKLVRFVLSNKDAITAVIPLFKTNPDFTQRLIKATIHAHCTDLNIKHEKLPFVLLTKLYPNLSIDVFLNDFVKIDAFIERYATLVQGYSGAKIYEAFKRIFEQAPRIETGLALAELLVPRARQEHLGLTLSFLEAVGCRKSLLTHIEIAKPLLGLVVDFHFSRVTKDNVLERLLLLSETLMVLDADHAVKTMAMMLTLISTMEGLRFFDSDELTALQLQGMAQLIERFNAPVTFIELCLKKDSTCDFSDVYAILHNIKSERSSQLLLICEYIYLPSGLTVVDLLALLKTFPHKTLDKLTSLIDLHVISPEEVLYALERPSVPQAIAQFEQALYLEHLERYEQQVDITEKISQIKYKSPHGDEDMALNVAMQEKLQHDYVTLMSYMMTTPILIEQDQQGNKKEFTVNALNEPQFHILFEHLKTKICANEKTHHHKIMLLALCCEALYRTTDKFPRYTQMLCVLHTINHDGDKICEIRTGEGKSITAALHAVLECAEGRSADIATENDQLASDGLNQFKRFYHYLNVSCGDKIIEAQGAQRDYINNGVNYSTPSNLFLFRAQMRLEKKALPNNSSFICDEIDAALTTNVQSRLAASVNALLHDTKSWSYIYRVLLDFVKEKEIFIENKCSRQDDIANFRNYLLFRSPDEALLKLIDRAPDDLFSTFIESAMIAQCLEEGVDFVIIPKSLEKRYAYAAPILESTKRPDERISYSAGLHQILHTLLTDRQHTFEIEPASETLVVICAKNVFDHYRLNGGRIIGFTGTAGSSIERLEFHEQNALRVYSYPAFHEDHCLDLGLVSAVNTSDQQLTVLRLIQDNEEVHPGQPVLIITPSPKETTQMSDYLIAQLNRPIQSYHGDKAGPFEERVIQKAGLNEAITVATQSLARGTDVEPEHPNGLFVINCCTDLTASDLRQIKGRPARNGKPGQFCSVINIENLSSDTSSIDDMEDRFKTHQQNISLSQQKERLKTRLLEEVRYYVIEDYFFSVRDHADRILSRQYGRDSSLIEQSDFLVTIRDFNDNAERHYQELLGDNTQLDAVDVFFDARIDEYQRALNRWLPEDKFQQFKAVEPLIPIENLTSLTSLNALTVEELSIVSELLATGWRVVGHQGMQEIIAFVDQLEVSFDPYFKGECGFQHALAQTLQKRKILDIETALAGVDVAQKQALEFSSLFVQIPVIGYLIPVEQIKSFLMNYVAVTKTRIQNEQWDDLALPKIDFGVIGLWYERLNQALTVANYANTLAAGPIPFIVNRILLPTLGFWLKSLFKTLFANSKSMHVQVLLGLDSILSDASKTLMFILSISDTKLITVGQCLDNVAPLLNNKTFLVMAVALLEKNGQATLIPYLQALPEYLTVLAPHRDKVLSDVLNGETLMKLFLNICQLEGVKKVLENTGFKDIVERIHELTPEFLATFNTLTFQQSIGFVKVMAHPEFSEFLKALPKQATFDEINTWLDSNPDAVPVEAQAAVQNLKHYQSSRERICENAKQSLLALNTNFSLSKADLKKHLVRLAPVSEPASTPIDTPAVSRIPWRMIGTVLLVLGIVVLNVVFFSIPLLITTALLGLTVAYRYFNQARAIVPEPVPLEVVDDSPPLPICVLVNHAEDMRAGPELVHDTDTAARDGLGRYGVFAGGGEVEQQSVPELDSIKRPSTRI